MKRIYRSIAFWVSESPVLELPTSQELKKEAFEEFFFGGDNYNTFYPEINGIEDTTPKEEEYLTLAVRALTATTVNAGSFSASTFRPSVLRAAAPALVGRGVYPNHDTGTASNVLGFVASAGFSGTKTRKRPNKQGELQDFNIPAGIDAVLKIDAKANPRIVRSIQTKALKAVSVAVVFEWEQSHPKMSPEEFAEKVGQIGPDNRMITRVSRNILDFLEISLVNEGADPYARVLDSEGMPIDVPEWRTYTAKYSANGDLGKPLVYNPQDSSTFSLSLMLPNQNNSLDLQPETAKAETPENIAMDNFKKRLDAMLKLVHIPEAKQVQLKTALDRAGSTGDYETAFNTVLELAETEQVHTETKKTTDGKQDSENLQVQNATAEPKSENPNQLAELQAKLKEVAELQAELERLKVVATEVAELRSVKDRYVQLLRNQVTQLATASTLEAEQAQVIKDLVSETSSVERLEKMLQNFGNGAVNKLKPRCKNCGKEEITFQKSTTPEPKESDDTVTPQQAQPAFNRLRKWANN